MLYTTVKLSFVFVDCQFRDVGINTEWNIHVPHPCDFHVVVTAISSSYRFLMTRHVSMLSQSVPGIHEGYII